MKALQEIRVVAGVIVKEDKLILAKRKKGDHLEGMWEFPGGKIEENESPFDSLKREIKEELGIDIYPQKELLTLKYKYPEKSVILHFILAKTSQKPIPIECEEVKEFSPKEIERLNLAPADRIAWEKIKCTISYFLN